MANNDHSQYVVPGAIALVVLLFGKKLTSAFNVFGDSAEDQANQTLITNANAYFSPNYYKGKSGAVITPVAFADAWCATVYGAHTWYNDDEAQVYGAFAQLHYKTQVSWLAERFYLKYQKSLIGYLQGFLNASELAKVSDIVLKLK